MGLNKYIDHTILKATASSADVQKLCEEAIEHEFYSVCVNGCYVADAKHLLQGTDVKVAAVVGFPLGAMTTASKVFEAKEFLEIPKNIERLRSNYLYKERYFSRQDMYKSTYRGEQSKENRDHNTGTAMYGQGRYSTTNRKYASKFGEVRTVDYEEMPSKALSFKNAAAFEMFEQELAKEHNIDKRHMYRNQDLSVIIKKMGYNGVTIGPKSDMIIVSYETKKKD